MSGKQPVGFLLKSFRFQQLNLGLLFLRELNRVVKNGHGSFGWFIGGRPLSLLHLRLFPRVPHHPIGGLIQRLLQPDGGTVRRQQKNPPGDGVGNVLSGNRSVQSNRPAFPRRVLYSFQPTEFSQNGGIRLPDTPHSSLSVSDSKTVEEHL